MQTKFFSNYFLQLLIFALPCKDLTLSFFFSSITQLTKKCLVIVNTDLYEYFYLERPVLVMIVKTLKQQQKIYSLTCAMLKGLLPSLTFTSLALLEIHA